MPAVPDLVLYTAQEEEIYEPIIKEFEERTNLMVKVERGSSEEMTGRRMRRKGRIGMWCSEWA